LSEGKDTNRFMYLLETSDKEEFINLKNGQTEYSPDSIKILKLFPFIFNLL